MTSLTVRFGNAITDLNYSSADNTTDDTSFSYSEINPYVELTFVDERTGDVQLPPSANHTLYLYCTNGISTHNITSDRMLVATNTQLDELKAQVQYSVTEIYNRNYLVRSNVESKNIYLVDANKDQVVQLLISLQDATGDFDNSVLKAKKYVEGTLYTITEHYFDAEDKVIAYLINADKYSLYIDNGIEERSVGDLNVDSVDLTKTLSIGEILVTNRTLGNLTWSLTNISDSISFSYIDWSGMTSSAEMYVYYENDTLLYYTSSNNKSRINFVYTVPNVSLYYKVNVKIHHYTFGLNTIDLWYVPPFGLEGGTFPYPLAFPLSGTIEGFGDDETTSWANFAGVLIVIGTAMTFSAVAGPVGAIVGVLVAAVFLGFGWWSGSIVLIGIALILGVLNKMNKDRRVNE